MLALVGFVAWSATRDVREYFEWAGSPRLTTVLHPAIDAEEFEEWWIAQNNWVRGGRGFLNVGQWLARRKVEAPRQPQRERVGTVYHGSTSSRPWEIDLGAITLHGGDLEVEVFAVPGSDCAYDYVEVMSEDGTTIRIEAEDTRSTSGDKPVRQHAPDNRWWLQSFSPFSQGVALLALKSETPPSLITSLSLPSGTYEVRLGSFTGDPQNGSFAIQVDIREKAMEADRESAGK